MLSNHWLLRPQSCVVHSGIQLLQQYNFDSPSLIMRAARDRQFCPFLSLPCVVCKSNQCLRLYVASILFHTRHILSRSIFSGIVYLLVQSVWFLCTIVCLKTMTRNPYHCFTHSFSEVCSLHDNVRCKLVTILPKNVPTNKRSTVEAAAGVDTASAQSKLCRPPVNHAAVMISNKDTKPELEH
jgi:hypothetical protein